MERHRRGEELDPDVMPSETTDHHLHVVRGQFGFIEQWAFLKGVFVVDEATE
jgi:hypothetical protein